MRRTICFAALVVLSFAGASPLAAQPGSAPVQAGLLRAPNTNIETPYLFSRDGTPTMRRQKVKRAIALREEAARLMQENGGTLTPEQQAYVRREAREILSTR